MVCSVKYKHNADIGKWKIMIEQACNATTAITF